MIKCVFLSVDASFAGEKTHNCKIYVLVLYFLNYNLVIVLTTFTCVNRMSRGSLHYNYYNQSYNSPKINNCPFFLEHHKST